MALKITSISAVMVVMVLLALASDHAQASSFQAWSGPGCTGDSEILNQCGCSNINLNGGYQFTYDGQTAALYNAGGCSGVAQSRFGSSTSGCTPFGWNNIFIQC